ncbi:MAG: T9SS type A sorting domain-containing protein, partial [Clostridia bacterium]|nr:T9SS type A sorting domain-containing protein [Clostridia bacterium]
ALAPIYTPGNSDKTTGLVTLTLTAQQNAPCTGIPTDAMQLVIKRTAIANAGSDAGICETSTYTLSGAVLHSTVFAWSTSGDGTFSNVNIQNPIYTPGTSDKIVGTVTLTLTAQQNAPCVGSASDVMLLSIQRNALANAGTDATICETQTHLLSTASASNYTSLLWSTSGDGTFSSTTILKPTYTPGVADKNNGNVVLTLKAVAVSPCSMPKTDTKTLTIRRDAIANAGTNATICETGAHLLFNASASNYTSLLWSTNGDGTFSSTTTLKPLYTPGTGDKLSGSATLTLTAQSQSPCSGNTSDSKVLSISPLPIVSAGNDVTVCADGGQLSGSAQNYTTVIWSTTGDGTFNNISSLSPVYVPGPQDIAARQATLTMAAGSINPCTSVAVDQVKMMIDIPYVTSSSVDDQMLKTGNILVLIFNTASAQPGQYTWYANGNVIPGQTGRIMIIYNVMPANAGEYQAVFTNPCGVLESNVAMVTVLQPYAQQLTIPEGWSGISSFVTPLNPALETVFGPITDDMILMANNSGIFWPGQNINTLGSLEITEGYKIKMQNSAQVSVSGNVSYPLSALTIPAGWSYLPVNTPCEENVEQFAAYPQIAMIKDIAGTGIYWPEMGINTIGNLSPGKAYFVLNNSASPLVMKYQGCNGFKTSMVMPASAVASPWPMVAATPVTHVFGFTREALAEFTDDDIIGAFDAKGNCVGVMQVDKMQYTNTLIVFGADNTYEFAKGMDMGEFVKFRSLRQLENAEVDLEVAFASRNASDGYFTENGISLIDHASALATGTETHASIDAAQIKVYPNPTRGELTIALGNVSLRDASVIITNQNGQVMLRRELQETNTQLNLENLPRGIYHLRITTGAFVKVERIILN